MKYESNIDVAGAARLLHDANHAVVMTHAKPDGDAFGSVIALAGSLQSLGKRADAWFMPPVPTSLQTLRGAEMAREHHGETTLGNETPDLVIVLDTGAWAQLSPMRAALEPHVGRMLIVDHHLSGDVPAASRLIDATAAACCEIVARLIDELSGTPIERRGGSPGIDPNPLWTPTVADALFTGVASDTGWFRFSNTTPATHELAARLLKAGVDNAALYQQLEQTERPQKLALMIRALDSIELLAGGRVAIMKLRAADFAETGAMLEETERFVDVPQAVSSVQVVILVTEPPADAKRREPAAIRVSFRSKPGDGAINVAELAGRFGGGGHARAAGAKIAGSLDDVAGRIKAEVLHAVGP